MMCVLCPIPPSAYLNAVLPVERGESEELPSSRDSTGGLSSLPLPEAVPTLMANGEGDMLLVCTVRDAWLLCPSPSGRAPVCSHLHSAWRPKPVS